MPHSNPPSPQNDLLNALPASDRKEISKLSVHVELPLGQILQAPNEAITYCYFIEAGVVSKVAILNDGEPVEVGIIGSEGLVGLPVVLGADRSPNEAVVQLAGSALRIGAKDLRFAFRESEALRHTLLLYTQAMRVQVTQTAACNCRHEAKQRLARWLLMVDDKFSVKPLPLTQEYLGMMLGVRRQQVSLAAKQLQNDGVITYRHGHIEVSDRAGLESVACECYATVAREFARLMHSDPSDAISSQSA